MFKKSPFYPKKFQKIPEIKGVSFYTFHVGFKRKNEDLLIVVGLGVETFGTGAY